MRAPAITSILACCLVAPAATEAAAADAAKPAAQAPSPEKLEQLVAPIALYPDPLLAQVLMASTYPLEIVEAARWVDAHPGLDEAALQEALQGETWDPSVKAMCGVPSVLKRMSDNLDWTQDLGDAFLADESAVMATVQRMRKKAHDAGKLQSTEQQTVTATDGDLVVESTDPKVVYVPTYYPVACYGSWYYPRWYYPAFYAPPPPGALVFSFAVGVTWGWAMWGGCRWHGHAHVDINVNHYNTFVNRTEVSSRRTQLTKQAGDRQWSHDPQHRKGVRYRDGATAARFGGDGATSRVSRAQARGYAPGDHRLSPRPGTQRPATQRPATQRPATQRPTTQRPATPRPGLQQPAQRSGGALSGARNPGFDRAASQRGHASRAGGGRGGGRRR